MLIISIDFESFYDKDFSLSKITTEEYVRSFLFETIGVATKVNDGPIEWVTGTKQEIKAHLDTLPWGDHLLLAHHCAFDSAILNWQFGITPAGYLDTMSMANALHGLTESSSLANLAKVYGEADKGTAVVMALGKRRADFSPYEMNEYGIYCVHDVELCYNIFNKMLPNFPKGELKVIDLTIRMFAEPRLELDEPMLVDDLVAIQAEKRESMQMLMELIGATDEVELKSHLMSNDKFAELLKSRGIDPPTKISEKTNKEAWAFAKTDEEFTDLMDSEDPIISTMIATRLAAKSTIGEKRTQAFINIAQRGTYPFSLKYSGAMITHRWCLTGDHEVLTPSGWVKISEWGVATPIMQWDSNNKHMQFVAASAKNEWDIDEEVMQFDDLKHKAIYTMNHKIPCRAHHSGNIYPVTAEQFKVTKSRRLAISGYSDGSGYSVPDSQLQLTIAMHDDGYNAHNDKNNMVRFRFKKARKISRIKQLLADNEITYQEYVYDSEPDVTVIKVRGRNAPDWLRTAKVLPVEWLLLDARQAKVVIDELQHWDGSKTCNHTYWVNTNKQSLDLLATLAHISGHGTKVTPIKRHVGWSPAWALTVAPNEFYSTGTNKQVIPYKGKVYCPTVPSGYFLCRRQDTYYITGNSGFDTNPQNLPRGSTLRKSIKAPAGHKLVVADLSNIELRLGMWLAGQNDMLDLIREGKDLYRDFSSVAFNLNYSDIAKDSNERFIGKVCHLSLLYQTGAAKLKNTIRIQSKGKMAITMAEAERLKNLYRDKHYKIVEAWQEGGRILEWILNNESHTAYGFLPVLGTAGIIKPNGLALPYPKLAVEYGPKGPEMHYEVRRGRATMRDKAYPGKCFQRCLAPDTEVLTNNGWKLLLDVSLIDKLWDGEQWVAHDGVIEKGTAETIEFGGVVMTSNHMVYCESGGSEARTADTEACKKYADKGMIRWADQQKT